MNEKKEEKINIFEKEISKLPKEFKEILLKKEKVITKVVKAINEKALGNSMGFFINPDFEVKNKVPTPNFNKLTLNFLLDDFSKPITEFNPRFMLLEDFDKFLIAEEKTDEYGQKEEVFFLKEDKSISFIGTSVRILRENCFDGIYDDLKKLGSALIYEDPRGFLSALKTIDIHRNMLLQKFEKYIVVYAGAGSWLRGEKSNDFDVFIVVDDTDVKKMPRMQVKEQLTRIIWQMSHEVAAITGVQIHIQVYLLTDFWDALKDAHPVMFTFLRDGVPFYDRGLYSAWKELLKLGKIKPSPEAIDMHMNVGTQLIDRAKKMFSEIVLNDIYNAVLSPSQAILMLKGYNPTTPKETIKMFKEVLLAKEKSVSKKDVATLEHALNMFKELEHNREKQIKGADVDKMIADADDFLKNIKKMFEEISEDRTKESIISAYAELLNQIRTLPGFSETSEKDIFKNFEKEYIITGKLPTFLKDSLKSFLKAKEDYKKGKVTTTEVNKVLKEARNILSEIKNLKSSVFLSEINKKKITITYSKDKNAEIAFYDNKIYLFDNSEQKSYLFDKENFKESKITINDLNNDTKFEKVKLSEGLVSAIKKILKTEEIFI